ncbi:MAG: GNAT family N-acetyltransferase [Verrucomicrobiota bacterium]
MTPTIHSTRLDLIPMTPAVLRALLAGDHEGAGRWLGVRWPADCEIHPDVLELRLGQLESDPELQPWLLRAIVLREEGVAVGTMGFHATPGHESLAGLSPGGVEFGYGLTAVYRRRGLATEAIEAMMSWAKEEHGVNRFVLSISPENGPSLALAAKLGFRKIGSHMDECDGPEDIFERVWGMD